MTKTCETCRFWGYKYAPDGVLVVWPGQSTLNNCLRPVKTFWFGYQPAAIGTVANCTCSAHRPKETPDAG